MRLCPGVVLGSTSVPIGVFFCLVAAGEIHGRGMVLLVFMQGLSYLWYFVLSYMSLFLLRSRRCGSAGSAYTYVPTGKE